MLKKKNIKINWDLLVCLFVVSLLFIPSLSRSWLIYDERIISEGIYFPTPLTFSETFEIISKFGLGFNTLSSNPIYSSNYITRTCPLGEVLGMLLAFFFKKSSFLYHLFSLSTHLINTLLVYFILKVFIKKQSGKSFLIPLLTIIWGIHPVMVEPILLATNFGAGVSYMFFFSFLLDFLINRTNNTSVKRRILIPILFLVPMLTNEYIVTLPFVLFIVSFYFSYQNNSFKKALKTSFVETIPYFTGFLFYTMYFLFVSKYQINHPKAENEIIILLERVFWLSPQIFFHFIKLVFFPRLLSIDQTLFVELGKTIFEPYSVFCFVSLMMWLFIPLYIFLSKKRLSSIFFLTWTFFFSLLPFLHILMPSYTLACERYLYAPLAMLIFSIGMILGASRKQLAIVVFLSFISIICFTRSYYRTLDWKDNFSFINSTYKSSTNYLFKAMRIGMLGKTLAILEPSRTEDIQNYFNKSLILLEKAKKTLEEDKGKYQGNLPAIFKSYGLDYNSLLAKTAFLEASSRCLELKEDSKIGLRILEPHIKEVKETDPRVLELYIHLLIQDKNYNKAKELLLSANSHYPNIPFITNMLFDYLTKYENKPETAIKYLLDSFKVHPYDSGILLKILTHYQRENDAINTAKYAYLYGLRTHSKAAYWQALSLNLDFNNFKEAKNIIDKLLKIDPNDPESLFFISKYYYKIKEYQKALDLLIKAYSISKEINTTDILRFDITLTLAKLFVYLGDKERAISLSQEITLFAGSDQESLKKAELFFKSLGLSRVNKNASQ
ncbi:MAG: hypothetical protein A3B68_06060 [Candidatus Melainabacteria bacterium RIFCSPHIGHO2_02_FULL_34_12]|nr:MAG: hypothetical protein A3B68_06060 [Candidatus Melainabacteria bacterium RIFCSPHIGHO2_02_FULL_34_12]